MKLSDVNTYVVVGKNGPVATCVTKNPDGIPAKTVPAKGEAMLGGTFKLGTILSEAMRA